MTRITGSVLTREADGSLGAPIDAATVTFEPVNGAGAPVTASTNAGGRYTAELAPGDYLAAADHPDAGTSPTWTRIANVRGDRPRTLNLFLPSAAAQLNTLASAFPGEIGVYALNLQSGQEVAVNAGGPMYLASVSKIALAVGCVDQMSSASELNDQVMLALRHHRDEGKAIMYQSLGQSRAVRSLLRTMIRNSDTTATDVLCEHYGIADINERIERLGIEGLRPLSSMIQLDRRRWWLRDRDVGFLPPFAFSLYRRHRITAWLDELRLRAPVLPRLSDAEAEAFWERYLTERRDQATPRAFGQLLKGIAERSLLAQSWKNDILLDTVMDAGGAGRFRGIVSGGRSIDSKGGSHRLVRNEAGIVNDASGTPVAVLAVFTQKFEAPAGEANAFVRAAGDLALQALGVDARLASLNTNPMGFTAPRPGQSFEPGDVPVIRWGTGSNVNGPLRLSLDGPGRTRVITRNATDDGEWHSFAFPDGLRSDDTYRLTLAGTDGNGATVTAQSARFTVGGTVHVLRPSSGDALAPGSTPRIRWVSSGVEGQLRIRLLRHGRVVDTFSSNANDDGEWHSWTVPADLPTGRGYQIEVTSVEDARITDRSGEFIIGGQIEVLAPTPGEALEIGTKPQIRWRSRDTVGPLMIALFGKGMFPVDVITTRATDDGEWHSWTVPDVRDGTGYRIAVSDTGARGIVGLSDLFQIGTRYEWLAPSVEAVAGAPWTPAARPHFFPYGQRARLRWRRIGPPVGQLRIDLLRGRRVVDTFTRNANDDGEWHSWTPEADALPPAATYQLRIRGVDRPTASGLSVMFSVGACIHAHIDDLRVTAGDTPRLQWTTEGIEGRLTIDLMERDGDRVARITNNAIDDGAWTSWTVPQNRTGWHRFRIRSNETPTVFGYTEWFRIR